MSNSAHRRIIGVVSGLAAASLFVAGCGDSGSDAKDAASSAVTAASSAAADASSSHAPGHESAGASGAAQAGGVKVKDADGKEVTLTGPIAAKYSAATPEQRTDLGAALSGEKNAGKGENGVVFQQFKGGVITAKNAEAGTAAHITWGRIRDAWNVNRGADGAPSPSGKNGSAGPLGGATSDETTSGTLKESTFEHGKITFDTKTGKVEVTVNGKTVPSGL